MKVLSSPTLDAFQLTVSEFKPTLVYLGATANFDQNETSGSRTAFAFSGQWCCWVQKTRSMLQRLTDSAQTARPWTLPHTSLARVWRLSTWMPRRIMSWVR